MVIISLLGFVDLNWDYQTKYQTGHIVCIYNVVKKIIIQIFLISRAFGMHP